MTPTLSVMIINWNGWLDIKKCLESIRMSSFADHEIIVIDNASTDGSVENLRTYFPEVKVHVNQVNLGHAKAVNQGFGLVNGKYILLLDADTELVPETISQLVSFITERQDVSVIAPRTFNADGSIQESARNFPSVMSGVFGRQSSLTRAFPNNPFSKRYLQRDKLNASDPFQVEQVSAACMIFPSSLVEEAGPWDEKYFAYWVDTDWCMNLKKLGKKLFCLPSARVIHYEKNRRGRKKKPSRIWNFHLGAFRLYRKHYTFGIFDPRSIIALNALSIRAGILLVINCFLPESD